MRRVVLTAPVRPSLKVGISLVIASSPGNYYGTPRPVHISPESPPITYQEHRNLLKKFRTRSKSLSNLEKAVEEEGVDEEEEEEGDSGEGDSAPPGRCCGAP